MGRHKRAIRLFRIGLAVILMVGLSFGTILTMVLLPVFYARIYRMPF